MQDMEKPELELRPDKFEENMGSTGSTCAFSRIWCTRLMYGTCQRSPSSKDRQTATTYMAGKNG